MANQPHSALEAGVLAVIIYNSVLRIKTVESGMTTCLSVRSALTQKGSLDIMVGPDLFNSPDFPSLSFFPLEERESEPGIRLLFVNITPRVPSSTSWVMKSVYRFFMRFACRSM